MASPYRRDGITLAHPATLLATWLGAGLLPRAPGTWGSAAALPFAWVLAQWGGSWALGGATVAVTLAGWWAAAVYVRRTGVADPSEIVVDEVAGQWLVLLFVPTDPLLYALGFAVFRALDITKPWPAGWADRHIEGGLGVMVDDLLAALYGAIIMAGAAWLWG